MPVCAKGQFRTLLHHMSECVAVLSITSFMLCTLHTAAHHESVCTMDQTFPRAPSALTGGTCKLVLPKLPHNCSRGALDIHDSNALTRRAAGVAGVLPQLASNWRMVQRPDMPASYATANHGATWPA